MTDPAADSQLNAVLNVGVVGVGGISRLHMPGWAASPHAAVTAGCDVSEEATRTWGKEYEVATLYTQYDQLLADDTIDIIDLAVPTAMHAKMTIAALEAGKHVFCEKPLAPTPDEIEAIIKVRDRVGKQTCTMQNQRYADMSKALKGRCERGELGDIYHARLWWLRRAELPAKPGFVYKVNSGGGPCIDIGVHILDLALWLMGNRKPVSVSGVARKEVAGVKGAFSVWGGKVQEDMDVEDFAAGFIRLDDGSTLILEVSWMMHHAKEECKAWFYGREGGAVYPDGMMYHADNEHDTLYDVQLKPPKNALGGHAQCCMDFAQTLATGQPSPIPAEQSLAVMRILDALYTSSEQGKEILL